MNNGTEQIFLVNSTGTESSTIQKPDANSDLTLLDLENVQDFSTVCRICATTTDFLIPIFEGEGLQNDLADKINKHLPIQVRAEDRPRLPSAVCGACGGALLRWHALAARCARADRALRDLMEQESSKSEQNKSPPSYEDSCPSISPEPLKTCPYCSADTPESTYKDHLVDAHSELLFHCQECDTYVDRKDFILHMSLHCVQYTNDNQEAETKKVIQKSENKRPRKPRKKPDVKDENENTKAAKKKTTCIKAEVEAKADNAINTEKEKSVNDLEENDFSDHSDADFGFGPLPESVFDAIEDSQDNNAEEYSRLESHSSEDADNPSTSEQPAPENTVASQKKVRTCPICSKTYTASSSYFYHMKYYHRQSKEHACDVCGRKFGTRGSLAQHASIHTGECDFECTKCGKKFRSKASLYIHSQTHIPNGGSKCGICGRTFRWRAALQRHAARHGAARAHACAQCGRAFAVRCDLVRHARTHERGHFSCDKCKATFAQPRYLRVHLRRKHGIGNSQNDESIAPSPPLQEGP
ncbi:zinc finger protein 16-like isoform X1 [Plodia interpunctella]|uniref:zinc finger protein 16-like isoform X1 n=1 Tax=Plodia interpunctella TaxID=58824 RepID=UPI0023688092|nr:zinc finger protein 16-like isoform X1 [Plodia interpunctella]